MNSAVHTPSPFHSQYSEAQNRALVEAAQNGDGKALENLLRLHQAYVYNVALKFVQNPTDAWDLTQEALVKVITNLNQFQFRSAFRTWLYRIVLNHFLTAKRRQYESLYQDFEQMGSLLDAIPDSEMTAEEQITLREEVEEMRVQCMSGMLLCLSRAQRMVYILGDVFRAPQTLAAELLELSPENYRIQLYRARRDLRQFMDNKCSLVNPKNPCTCPKKTKTMLAEGKIDPQNRVFNPPHARRVHQIAEAEAFQVCENTSVQAEEMSDLFSTHPFSQATEQKAFLNQILDSPAVKRMLEDPAGSPRA